MSQFATIKQDEIKTFDFSGRSMEELLFHLEFIGRQLNRLSGLLNNTSNLASRYFLLLDRDHIYALLKRCLDEIEKNKK